MGTFRMALGVWVLSATQLFSTELTALITLTLPEAIERALQQNEEVRMAREDVDKSKAEYSQAAGRRSAARRSVPRLQSLVAVTNAGIRYPNRPRTFQHRYGQ